MFSYKIYFINIIILMNYLQKNYKIISILSFTFISGFSTGYFLKKIKDKYNTIIKSKKITK